MEDNLDTNDTAITGIANNGKSMGAIGVKAQNTIAQRLASFAVIHSRKRASSAKGAKTAKLQWPSENPSPLAMAEAGFYYKPTIKSPDNVVCYLCQKNLDGWEPEDDPRIEHLSHSDDCGWAWNMCTKLSRLKAPLKEDPMEEKTRDTRHMTYGGKWWPHEAKKGWRAKVESLADAGFIYMPTPESDDRVYCPYCELAIEHWEPKDSPREIHRQEKPTCAFVTYGVALSLDTTIATENNILAEKRVEESIAKASRARKGKGRKPSTANASRSRKVPASELDPDGYQDMVMRGGSYDEGTIATAPKSAAKSRKRTSAVMEADSKKPLFTQEAINAKLLERQQQNQEDIENARRPPTKRRNTRASMAAKLPDLCLDVSIPSHMQMNDNEASIALRSYKNTPEKPITRSTGKRASAVAPEASKVTKSMRRSTRNSTMTLVPLSVMDDEEIDQALEMDLLRALSDEEGELDLDMGVITNIKLSPVSPLPESPPNKSKRRLTKTKPSRASTANTTADARPARTHLRPSQATSPHVSLAQSLADVQLVPNESVEDILGTTDRANTEKEGAKKAGRLKKQMDDCSISNVNGEEQKLRLDSQKHVAKDVQQTAIMVSPSSLVKGDPKEAEDQTIQLAAPLKKSTKASQGTKRAPKKSKIKATRKASNSSTPKILTDVTMAPAEPMNSQDVASPQFAPSGDQKQQEQRYRLLIDDLPVPEETYAGEEETFVDQEPMNQYYESLRLGTFDSGGNGIGDEETIDAILDTYHHDPEFEEVNGNASLIADFARSMLPTSLNNIRRPNSSDSSQATVPNTQFTDDQEYQSTQPTFMTLKKGVSFVTSAEHQLNAEAEASFQVSEEEPNYADCLVAAESPLDLMRHAFSPIMQSLTNNSVSLITTPRREDYSKSMVTRKPWRAINLDVVFHDLEATALAISSELTEAEKGMTVTDWIKQNALLTEKQLLANCERIVSSFLAEGQRALGCLDAIEV